MPVEPWKHYIIVSKSNGKVDITKSVSVADPDGEAVGFLLFGRSETLSRPQLEQIYDICFKIDLDSMEVVRN